MHIKDLELDQIEPADYNPPKDSLTGLFSGFAIYCGGNKEQRTQRVPSKALADLGNQRRFRQNTAGVGVEIAPIFVANLNLSWFPECSRNGRNK